jgi:hypothetical protein
VAAAVVVVVATLDRPVVVGGDVAFAGKVRAGAYTDTGPGPEEASSRADHCRDGAGVRRPAAAALTLIAFDRWRGGCLA